MTTDKNGREIMPGDTLKIYHFTGARRKRHYLYKFVKQILPNNRKEKAYLDIMHLDLSGGSYLMPLDGKLHADIEIVQGYGIDVVPFDQRAKVLLEDV